MMEELASALLVWLVKFWKYKWVLISSAIVISGLAFWDGNRPDPYQSQLDEELPAGTGYQEVMRTLDDEGFNYTLYEYSEDGAPYAPLFVYYPEISKHDFRKCEKSTCMAIMASKFDSRALFPHEHNYLWLFSEGVVVRVYNDSFHWLLLRI